MLRSQQLKKGSLQFSSRATIEGNRVHRVSAGTAHDLDFDRNSFQRGASESNWDVVKEQSEEPERAGLLLASLLPGEEEI